MDPLVVAAMLAASLLHASWHALVKASDDRVVALAGMNLVSGACALALLPLAGGLPAAAWAVIAGSVLLHAGYKIALARLYLLADLGQAYPLARGFTPILAAALAFALLGEVPGAAALAGLTLISAGIALLSATLDLYSDPADRFIAATAIMHQATLLTADARLLDCKHALRRQNARK